MEEVMSEVDGSVSVSPPARPSRRTAQASRVLHVGGLCKFVYNVDVIA